MFTMVFTFWMIAVALPGSPLMSSVTILTARVTASARPLMLTLRSTPSGKFWSTTMWAWEACCRARMVSPPRPMTRPTMPGGHSTT